MWNGDVRVLPSPGSLFHVVHAPDALDTVKSVLAYRELRALFTEKLTSGALWRRSLHHSLLFPLHQQEVPSFHSSSSNIFLFCEN